MHYFNHSIGSVEPDVRKKTNCSFFLYIIPNSALNICCNRWRYKDFYLPYHLIPRRCRDSNPPRLISTVAPWPGTFEGHSSDWATAPRKQIVVSVPDFKDSSGVLWPELGSDPSLWFCRMVLRSLDRNCWWVSSRVRSSSIPLGYSEHNIQVLGYHKLNYNGMILPLGIIFSSLGVNWSRSEKIDRLVKIFLKIVGIQKVDRRCHGTWQRSAKKLSSNCSFLISYFNILSELFATIWSINLLASP